MRLSSMGAITHGTLSCGCPTSSSPLPNASMHRLKYRAPGIIQRRQMWFFRPRIELRLHLAQVAAGGKRAARAGQDRDPRRFVLVQPPQSIDDAVDHLGLGDRIAHAWV